MKKILLALPIIFLGVQLFAQTPAKRYTLAYYSVENLFDTISEPSIMDEEFTPNGPKKWTSERYWKKQSNLEKAIYELSASVKGYPAVIGLSEVENRTVLQDLVSMPKLKAANYQIIHYDSPEARGIDAAFLYRPDQFRYEGSYPIPIKLKEESSFKTRDILSVWGTIEGERFCFFVCHWPSRRGGQDDTQYKRIGAARILRHAADSIMRQDPAVNIVIMGNMNDDPTDVSLKDIVGATGDREKVKSLGFYNPFYEMFERGSGTVAYSNVWSMYDNIIINRQLVDAPQALHLVRSERSQYWGNIFSPPFLREQSGIYKNEPFRTYAGNNYVGGFSGHFPIYILVGK